MRGQRFHDLAAILESPLISEQKKIQALVECLLDERALMVADDEGMTGGRPSRLDEVLECSSSFALCPSSHRTYFGFNGGLYPHDGAHRG